MLFRYVLLAQLVLASVASAADKPAVCEFAKKSLVSLSPSGLAQVSNLGNIEITCRVSGRPFPSKPGESRPGLKLIIRATELLPDGSKKMVPSEAHEFGGGFDGLLEVEWVTFNVQIPLEPAERNEEARRVLAKLDVASPQRLSGEARQQALMNFAENLNQHRVGHFQLECRVMDGERLAGLGNVEVEVLFKGRISDYAFTESPPAQN